MSALARPPRLIGQIAASRRQVERNYSSMSRSTRWPLGLLDDTRQRLNEEREERARQSQIEGDNLSKELRYTQQVVAAELAGWQEMHARLGRRALRDLAKGMLVMERMRLEGIRRALRKVRDGGEVVSRAAAPDSEEEETTAASFVVDEATPGELPGPSVGHSPGLVSNARLAEVA